jgi:hypothetical protein
MNRIIVKTFLLLILIGAFACTAEDKQKEEIPERIETDDMMALYKDSLKQYFSKIEIDLIRQYKINHENLKTTDDFYVFYRNANTLRKSLTKRLNKKNQTKDIDHLHPLPWFEKLAKGYEVLRTPDKKHFGVYFDYNDLLEHAEQTEGEGDDYFIRLLQTAYFDHSDNPQWLNIIDLQTGNFCSQLGSGTHFKILGMADRALAAASTFHKEIQKTKVQVLSDIVFNRRYCSSKKKVVTEIDEILSKVDLKEKEQAMLEKRKAQLIENASGEIQFGCSSGDCELPAKA